jgi:Lipopolysaccharide kinase (Kdo/WaaP) family
MINVHDAVSPFAGSPVASPGGLIPDGMYPSGYGTKMIRDATIVAHGSAMDLFESMLQRHRTLYEWASAQPERRAMSGRQTVYSVPLPDVEEVRIVVRHNTHGGMFAPFSRDLFRQPRAADELRRSWTLRHVGIPTSHVLGYAMYPSFHGTLWRVDVVSREIAEASDLATLLARTEEGVDHAPTIDATITLLRRLARTYAYHPDLNVKNILISTEDDESQLAHVLDVDTLRFAEKNAEWMNVDRLVRSARKWLSRDGQPGFATLIERLGG